MKIQKKQETQVVGTTIAIDLPVFERPKFADKIKWPDDITQLTAQNVSELLGKYTALLCYAEAQLAKYQQEILMLENKASQLAIFIYKEEPSIRTLEKNKREMKIATDDGMIKIKSRLSTLRSCEVATSMFVKNYERFVTALSRELSRKSASGDGLRYARSGQ
jgi:hypothetical protein